MSDLTPEPDDLDEQQEQQQSRRQRAKERDEERARLAQAERELAVFKADLPGLTAKQREALATLHKGDDLTPDALKVTAEEYGFLAPPTDETVSQSELQSHAKAAEAAVASPPATPDMHKAMAAAGSVDEIMRIAQQNGVPTSWDDQ